MFSLFIAGLLLTAESATALPKRNLQGHTIVPKDTDNSDPVPGESSLFQTYLGKQTPLQSKYLQAIPPSKKNGGSNSSDQINDDNLFQNLLSAEWVIYSFYQAGVEAFESQDFTAIGLPNTTYDRIQQIRDNEAGHIRIFQDSISDLSIKPGPCKYEYGFGQSAEAYLAIQVSLEVSSMAFLTGLVEQANLANTRAALVAIGETETRHNAWALADVWNVNPFAGPSDTVYPYANQILDLTNRFVVPGSCPKENPPYPSPSQHLPMLGFVQNSTTGQPGSPIQFAFTDLTNQPNFNKSEEYYAVYFHGVNNITMPFNTAKNTSSIPKEFDSESGIILAAIASEPGAPTLESVVAGPLVLLQQPVKLSTFA